SPRPCPPDTTLLPYTTLFRSWRRGFRTKSVPAIPRLRKPRHAVGLMTPPDRTPARLRESAKCSFRQRVASLPRHLDGHAATVARSEEHTSELQSRVDLVCRLL